MVAACDDRGVVGGAEEAGPAGSVASVVGECDEFDGGAGPAELPAVFGVTVDFDDDTPGFVVSFAARVAGLVVFGHAHVVGTARPQAGQRPCLGGRHVPQAQWRWSQQQVNMMIGPLLVSA